MRLSAAMGEFQPKYQIEPPHTLINMLSTDPRAKDLPLQFTDADDQEGVEYA